MCITESTTKVVFVRVSEISVHGRKWRMLIFSRASTARRHGPADTGSGSGTRSCWAKTLPQAGRSRTWLGCFTSPSRRPRGGDGGGPGSRSLSQSLARCWARSFAWTVATGADLCSSLRQDLPSADAKVRDSLSQEGCPVISLPEMVLFFLC